MKIVLGALAALTAAVVTMDRDRAAVETLPFYFDHDRTPQWLSTEAASNPSLHRIDHFSLFDQRGHRLTRDSVAGKIYIASFFFTRCQSLCPRLRSNLALVRDTFRGDSNVMILSHSMDPSADDTAMLQRYAEANDIDAPQWRLLTGDSAQMANLAADEYLAQLPDTVNGRAVRAVHSETFVLVDGGGRIRGVYDGSLEFDTRRMIEDVATLRGEKAP